MGVGSTWLGSDQLGLERRQPPTFRDVSGRLQTAASTKRELPTTPSAECAPLSQRPSSYAAPRAPPPPPPPPTRPFASLTPAREPLSADPLRCGRPDARLLEPDGATHGGKGDVGG